MSIITADTLLAQLRWRYAVKKFDSSKKIEPKLWQALMDSLVLTPSSYGLQPWKFLVIETPSLRKQLRAASWNQSQVEDASHYVIFATMRKINEAHIQKFMTRIAEVRNVAPETLAGFSKSITSDVIAGPRSLWAEEWMARQAYIALGNFMTSAALLGIDACPMEGLDPAKYDEILGLQNTEFKTIVCCAAGFRHADDKLAQAEKVRFKSTDIIEYR